MTYHQRKQGATELAIPAPLLLKARRFVVNLRQLPFEIFVGRGSVWGNDWSHLVGSRATHFVGSREEAIRKHMEWFLSQKDMIERARRELRKKVLGCFCTPLLCHGFTLAAVANASERELRSILRYIK
jgi:hypothetical protein